MGQNWQEVTMLVWSLGHIQDINRTHICLLRYPHSMSVRVRGELLNILSKLNNKIHVFSHVSHSKSRTPENTKKQNTPYALHHTKCCVLDVRSRRLSSGRLVICNFKHGWFLFIFSVIIAVHVQCVTLTYWFNPNHDLFLNLNKLATIGA